MSGMKLEVPLPARHLHGGRLYDIRRRESLDARGSGWGRRVAVQVSLRVSLIDDKISTGYLRARRFDGHGSRIRVDEYRPRALAVG